MSNSEELYNATVEVPASRPPFLILGSTISTVVQEVQLDQYSNRHIHSCEDYIVLYGPGDENQYKFEIVLNVLFLDQVYSLYRSETLRDAETRFSIYKHKVPVLLYIAPEMRNVEEIQKLCDILMEHPTWTLAHLAAYFALHNAFTYDIVNSHLDSGDSETGISPLQVAVQTNNLRTVEMLIAKSSLEHLDHSANTVYHYAATSTKEIILALGRGLPNILNSRNSRGYTPLHVACFNNKLECMKALLLIGADVNIPVSEGQLSSPHYVGDFLHNKSNVLHAEDMKFDDTPLHWSDSREMRAVPQMGVWERIESDSREMRLVPQMGVERIESDSREMEIIRAEPEGMEILLDKMRDFIGRTALHMLVMLKLLSGVVFVLSYKPNVVDIIDSDGNTPLHLAVKAEALAIVQALIGFGADMNARNFKGETPMHKANIHTMKTKKIIYLLHAVGAQRCPLKMTHCHRGCKHNETYTGVPPSELPRDESRMVLDDVLHMVGMEKMAEHGNRKRIKGGRLLCLDGGGIRGLVLIQTLLEIESVLRKPVVRCFDWIAGTSTGGILALGLAKGMSLRECQALFFRIREDVFVGLRPYSSERLEKVLKEYLGANTVMANIQKPKIMITGVLADRKPVDLHLFRNYESPIAIWNLQENSGSKLTLPPQKQLLWKAARATVAAPSYFRAFGRFLDGGLIANNPTLDAMTEIYEHNLALKCRNREEEAVPLSLVVSLGTGIIPTCTLNDIDLFWPKSFDDIPKVASSIPALGTLLVDQATASDGRVVDRARTWCSMIGVPYYRFDPQLSTEVAANEKSNEKLVDMIWTAKAHIHANRDVIQELATIIERDFGEG